MTPCSNAERSLYIERWNIQATRHPINWSGASAAIQYESPY